MRHEGNRILVRIRDHGSWRSPGDHSEERGRGTAIMQALSRDFTRTTGATGTTVTLSLPARS